MKNTEHQPSAEDELTDTQYQRGSHDQETRLSAEQEESAAVSDEQDERQAVDNENNNSEGEPVTTTLVLEASALTAGQRRARRQQR